MIETKQHTDREPNDYRTVQFKDGETALRLDKTGQSTEWSMHKHTRSLNIPGFSEMAMVTMSSGRRFGIGKGVIVQLPSFDREKGNFEQESALSARDITLMEVPEIKIGESWLILGQDDPVKNVMVRYKVDVPGSAEYSQIGVNSPFPEIAHMLEDASEKLQSQALPIGFTAISGSQES